MLFIFLICIDVQADPITVFGIRQKTLSYSVYEVRSEHGRHKRAVEQAIIKTDDTPQVGIWLESAKTIRPKPNTLSDTEIGENFLTKCRMRALTLQ